MKIAAIDAGSNAIRLAIGRLEPHYSLKVEKTYREAVRLGHDAFSNGVLSDQTVQRTCEAFVKFSKALNQRGITRLKAVATSAMREVENKQAVVDRVKELSGIELEVISGKAEAHFIHEAVTDAVNCEDRTVLLIDIGGGSVELSLIKDNQVCATECLPLGTVRLLKQLEKRELKASALPKLVDGPLNKLWSMLHKALRSDSIDLCVGTGGNIEALSEMRTTFLGKKGHGLLTAKDLDRLHRSIQKSSLKERTEEWKLRYDRADVIVPATFVLNAIVQHAGVKEIKVPYVGLKEGLLVSMAKGIFKRAEQGNDTELLKQLGIKKRDVKTRKKRKHMLVG